MIVFEIPETAIRRLSASQIILSRAIVLKRNGVHFTLQGNSEHLRAIAIPEPLDRQVWVIELEPGDSFEFLGHVWELRQSSENFVQAQVARTDWPTPTQGRRQRRDKIWRKLQG